MSALLVPPPRVLRRRPGSLAPAAIVLLPADSNPGLLPAAERLRSGFGEAGTPARLAEPAAAPAAGEMPIRLALAASGSDPQAYRLSTGRTGVELSADGAAGLYHGAETLLQWALSGPPGSAPPHIAGVEVEDGPAITHRGYLLDVSRNRVPTMESLFDLVDRLAVLKLNQLQLYTEHTFAYRGHEVVWRDASPLTADEIRRLDAHCRARFVELVPNQNSFGHLHRWLRHEPYRRLAECPEGVRHPFGDDPEPFSLCPADPGSLELLADLYDQLLPQFTSRQLNVGCDETFDLGRGRSAEACRERGAERVYLEFLRRIHGLAAARGHRIQFWGDILAKRPELLAEVPTDAIVLEWGYEAAHPFVERAGALAAAGLDFYLCPGTSSWNSFGGRLDNALANLAAAATAAREHGASGYLITDWGDFGHLQPPPVSWGPLIAGAAYAWNPAAAAGPAALPLAELIDRYAEAGLPPGTGAALVALGNLYRRLGVQPANASALFKLVIHAGKSLDEAGLEGLEEAELEEAATAVAAARGAGGGSGGHLAGREIAWVAGMLELACDLGLARLREGGREAVPALPAARRKRLRRQLGRRIEELTPLWLARSRPGGLDDSRQRLQRLERLLA